MLIFVNPVFNNSGIYINKCILEEDNSSWMQLLRLITSLINRFHAAVRLFSNRSQMTSKRGKNKKVAHAV